MNRITTILPPDHPPSTPPSPRSRSLTAPAITTQRVAQHSTGTTSSTGGYVPGTALENYLSTLSSLGGAASTSIGSGSSSAPTQAATPSVSISSPLVTANVSSPLVSATNTSPLIQATQTVTHTAPARKPVSHTTAVRRLQHQTGARAQFNARRKIGGKR